MIGFERRNETPVENSKIDELIVKIDTLITLITPKNDPEDENKEGEEKE